ncbi:fungal-specific transcription factor domain-containing protein [Mycena filopes]|nr:fungal-specific transcription factor domain-containing protein [Mycena filopes]
MSPIPTASGSGTKAHRARQIACVECRRVKLKCDKTFPCTSCIRRGCGSICPTGTLRSAGRGRRSVMFDVPELTTVISAMGDRIRQLEQAIAKTRGASSTEEHPLLSTAPSPLPTESHNADALGLFSVNDDGDAVYFGPTAGSEALLSIEGFLDPSRAGVGPVSDIREAFPFAADGSSNWDADQSLELLFARLPLEVRAWSLCGTYYRSGCWTGMPVNQSEATELLDLVYHPHHSQQHPITTQQLAVLYLLFALGALVDLDLPPYNSEADEFFDLGVAAMSAQVFLESPTVVTVQALALIASYYGHGGARFSTDAAWSTISLASNISQQLGLHRESFASKLSPELSNRCRALFWETYTIETTYGLWVGRPTGTFLSDISCTYPPDDPDDAQPFVKIFPGYRHARWGYTRAIIAPIMESFLKTAKPSYETVLELDQRIRKYMLSSPFETYPVAGNEPPYAFIQRNVTPRFGKLMLLYIHNHSFMEALQEDNPFSGPYSPSFLACYRSASEIIKADYRNFKTHPQLFTRWWAIWKSLFSSAVIVGTVAIKFPTSKTAPHAIVELFTAVDLIERGAVFSEHARSGLGILQQMRNKAITIYSQLSGRQLAPPTSEEPVCQLGIFAGYTQIVARKVLQHGSHTEGTPPPSQSESRLPSPPPPLPWTGEDGHFPSVFDPSIVRYFNEVTPFREVPPLAEVQAPAFDAGLFFLPQLSTMPDVYPASAYEREPPTAGTMDEGGMAVTGGIDICRVNYTLY